MSPQVPSVQLRDLPVECVLLDVREDEEWAAGHAPGAVHVPMSQLQGRLGDVPAGSPLYVICRSGGRSARVTAYLNGNGWDALNVEGGMLEWESAGRQLVNDGNTPPQVL